MEGERTFFDGRGFRVANVLPPRFQGDYCVILNETMYFPFRGECSFIDLSRVKRCEKIQHLCFRAVFIIYLIS